MDLALPVSSTGDNWRVMKFARKPHRCDYCGGEIVFRESYILHQVGTHPDLFRMERFHTRCATLMLSNGPCTG